MNVLNCTNNHIERFALDLFEIVKLEADDVCCVLAVADGGIQLGKAGQRNVRLKILRD
jgi:hypothetical protein